MTTPLHPDGLCVLATPICDGFRFEDALNWDTADTLERKKRVAEAQLVIAVTLLNQILSGDCKYYETWEGSVLTHESYHDKIPKILAKIRAIGENLE